MAAYDWVPTATALAFYAIIETLWLSIMMKPFYSVQFDAVQPRRRLVHHGVGDKSIDVVVATVLAYTIQAIVVYVLVIHDFATGTALVRPVKAVMCAALLGLGIYAAYNLTNRATLSNYSWTMVIVDTCYGVVAITAIALMAWCTAAARRRDVKR